MQALFEPEATFASNLGPQDRADWGRLLAWNAAQGTALIQGADCAVSEEVAGVSVRLVCPHDNLDAVVQAVGSPSVPIRLTLLITPAGIVEWRSIFGTPDFNEVGRPFAAWMIANHPDIVEAATVGFGNWDSVREAEQNGILTAQYALEWATYLEESNCAYDDGC